MVRVIEMQCFIPMGKFYGASSWAGEFFCKSFIPVTIGSSVDAGVFIAIPFTIPCSRIPTMSYSRVSMKAIISFAGCLQSNDAKGSAISRNVIVRAKSCRKSLKDDLSCFMMGLMKTWIFRLISG